MTVGDDGAAPRLSAGPIIERPRVDIASGRIPLGMDGPIEPTRMHDGAHEWPNRRVLHRRELFWSNIVRDTLMALSAVAAHASGRVAPSPTAAAFSPAPSHPVLDGRIGIVTALGQRIAIADVLPVFAVTDVSCREGRERSEDVQCSVFRITTPSGEIFTLPISQIIAVHALSDELLKQLEHRASMNALEAGASDDGVPFGFKAYTSLARSESEPRDATNPDPARSAEE